jgi:transcriptional regulator with XRE-family HTH domain
MKEAEVYNIIMYDTLFKGIPIGTQIRSLRTSRGWSLATLADKAGTSAPTVHRYENGWDRFEIATLKRIGAALGARVEVALVPGKDSLPHEPARLDDASLVELLTPLFWDRALEKNDLLQYSEWVLERVLMFGNRKQVAASRTWFGDALVVRAAKRRGVDPRTRNYWSVVLKGACDASESAGR